MLLWCEEFETGHTVIDAQHKMLVTYINRLEGLSQKLDPDREVLRFLEFMEHYTAVHFQHEEGCMDNYQCPVRAENKVAHREFLLLFQQFKRRFETEGCGPGLLQELHEACAKWLREHIMRVDKQIGPCVVASHQTSHLSASAPS
jgi:hemerythrin